jgi:hypothetical protein
MDSLPLPHTRELPKGLPDRRGAHGRSERLPGDSAGKGPFTAFVLQHTTGSTWEQEFQTLEEALGAINGVRREWAYESASGCGGKSCNEGNCGTGSCEKVSRSY